MSPAFLLLVVLGQAGPPAPPPSAGPAPAAPAPYTPLPPPPATAAPAGPAPGAPVAAPPAGTALAPPASPGTAPPPVPYYPPGTSGTPAVNMAQWDSNSLPTVYERSEQGPLTDSDVTKLAQAGFPPDQLVRMVAERRCACDASPDGLVRLKQAGVEPAVIQAVSTYALQPNQVLNLEVTLDFTGEGHRARNAYIYVFVDDGDLTRVFSANIDDLLRRPNAHETTIDNSDFLIARTVRRIVLPGQVALKTYGRHTLLVVTSANPGLTHPSQLRMQDRVNSQAYQLDYPRASLQSLCRLNAGFRRDPQLADRWRFAGSRFECEWN